MARFPKTPADVELERDLARRWWRRLPLDRRAEIARNLAECEFPWQRWFFSRLSDVYLDELHGMATLFEAGDALEFEPSPMHPDARKPWMLTNVEHMEALGRQRERGRRGIPS